MMNRFTVSVATIATLSVALIAAPAIADPVTYSGKDAGANRFTTRPNSNAAAASFDTAAGALPGSNVTLITFENFSTGSKGPNEPLGGGVTVGADNLFGEVVISNNIVGNDVGFSTTAGLGNVKFLQFIPLDSTPTPTLTFTFSPGITGFGGYFSGIGTESGTARLRFNDGSAQTYNLRSLVGNNNGGVGFFGFLDQGKTISTLEIVMTGSDPDDIFGMDDLRIVRSTVVPEPGEYAAMAMAGLSVCGLMLRARRKNA
jgi:hypothetical protein